MAIYHLTTKVFSRGKGQSAIAAAAYRSGDRLRDEATGDLKLYTARANRIEFTGLFLPPSAPDWARDRNAFWNRAEQAETRKDGRLAREIEVSLPHELTDEQRQRLVQDFVREAFVRKGYAADVAIHAPDGQGDERNYHAHILIPERKLGPDGFAGLKDRAMNSKEQLGQWREQWAHLANRHLERHGHAARIDHRSLEAQGIDREATVHVGYAGLEITQRGGQSERMEALRDVLARNDERIELRQDLAAVERELKALTALQPQEVRPPEPRAPAETVQGARPVREPDRPREPQQPAAPDRQTDSRAQAAGQGQAAGTGRQPLNWATSPGMVAQQRSATKIARRVKREAEARVPQAAPAPKANPAPEASRASQPTPATRPARAAVEAPVMQPAPSRPVWTTSPRSVTVEPVKPAPKADPSPAENRPLNANEIAASASNPALRARYNKQEDQRQIAAAQTPAETAGGKKASPNAPAEKLQEISAAERRVFEQLTKGMTRANDEREQQRQKDGGRGGRGRSR